jgi:DNA-binding protein Fis
MEKGVFSAVLINTRGNQAQACQFLGISRLCLYKKLKKYKRLS